MLSLFSNNSFRLSKPRKTAGDCKSTGTPFVQQNHRQLHQGRVHRFHRELHRLLLQHQRQVQVQVQGCHHIWKTIPPSGSAMSMSCRRICHPLWN